MVSTTQTDVIITQYRAEFSGGPFQGYSEWRIMGGWEYRTTLKRRRRWTVAREFDGPTIPASKVPIGDPFKSHTGIGIHPSNLIDPDAVVVFVPDSPGSRYGTAVLVEEKTR